MDNLDDRAREDTELALRARGGDKSALNELYQRSEPMIGSLAHKFHRVFHRTTSLDDLKQAGALGFMTAVRLFDPAKGKFSSLLFLAVRHSIQAWLRTGEQVHLSGIFISSGEMEYWLDAGSRGQKQADARHDAAVILDKLEMKHRWILEQIFGLNGDGERTQAEIAKQIGRTRERVHQKLLRAIVEVRKLNRVPITANHHPITGELQ